MADVPGMPLDPCGCCEEPGDERPRPVQNPPGLTAIAYRISTHGRFRAALEAGLAGPPPRGMPGLTTRDPGDPTIALLDAWAAVLDVLTFYQERIANEGYLRTATERRSVLQLAGEVGYVPSPGVAASTQLAFQLETAAGAPASVTIPPGTRVQSVPGPCEQPQTFETVGPPLEARPGWNAIGVQLTREVAPRMGATSLYVDGVATGLRTGDALLFVGRQRGVHPRSQRWEVRVLRTVEPQHDARRTLLAWDRPLGHRKRRPGKRPLRPSHHDLQVFPLSARAAIFGHNAPDWNAMAEQTRRQYGGGLDWPRFVVPTPGHPDSVDLDAVYPHVQPGTWLVLHVPGVLRLYSAAGVETAARTDWTLTGRTTRVRLDGPDLERFHRRVRDTGVWISGAPLTIAEAPIPDPLQGDRVPLATGLDLPAGRAVIVTGRRARVVVAPDVESLALVPGDGSPPVRLRPGQSLLLTAPVTAQTYFVRDAGGREGTVAAAPGQLLPQVAAPGDEGVSEAVTVRRSLHDDPAHTVLWLSRPLQYAYDRTTVTIAANVAPATHGETRQEVLGSGDGSRPFQRFSLKQSPLTSVPAANASGAASTLRVAVDDLEWQEARTLAGLPASARAYQVSIADDGTVSVEFGDGSSGRRLPTGVENVTATYRVGTGLAGLVKAGQLTQLLTRPLGTRSVTNPLAPAVAADPESLDDARANAPLTVAALDRVVSLTDFEDFARAFAAISKARAAWVWSGEVRLVHLTVAGVAGKPVDRSSDTYANLVAAIAAAGDGHQRLRVDSYEALTFAAGARLYLTPGFDAAAARSGALSALTDAFSFERRSLTQPVSASEVVSVLQASAGVEAVDLTAFHLAGEPAPADPILRALPARWVGGALRPAQLITLDPAALTLTVAS